MMFLVIGLLIVVEWLAVALMVVWKWRLSMVWWRWTLIWSWWCQILTLFIDDALHQFFTTLYLLHSPPLISRPLNPALQAPPAGPVVEPRPQTHFWHILRLGNASGCKNFNGFHTRIAVGKKEVQYDFKPTKEVPVYRSGTYHLTSSPALAPTELT